MKTLTYKAMQQLLHSRWAFALYLVVMLAAVSFVWSRYVVRAQAATQAMIQNETIMLETLTQARTAVIYVDRESRIVKWGGAASFVFGWPRHEAIGQRLDILMPDATVAENHRAIVSAALGGRPESDDPKVKIVLCKARRKDGEVIDIVIRLTVDHDNQRVLAMVDRLKPGLIYDTTTHRTMP